MVCGEWEGRWHPQLFRLNVQRQTRVILLALMWPIPQSPFGGHPSNGMSLGIGNAVSVGTHLFRVRMLVPEHGSAFRP